MNRIEERGGLDVLSAAWNKHISKFDGIVFGSSFALALLVHLYMFTHKFINHDDVGGLFSDCSFGLSSGRWLLHFITGINGNFSSAWLNGIAGSIFLAIAVVLFVRLFSVRHYITALVIATSMVSFPTVASTYAYMFCSHQYLFALVSSVMGAYLIRKERLCLMLLGSISIALSMGCYQAYFCLAAVILFFAIMFDLCDNRWKEDTVSCIFTGLKYVAFLAIGMILYYVILKLCLWYTGTELLSYKGINEMGHITPTILFKRITDAFSAFGNFYRDTNLFHGCFPLVVKISWILDGIFVLYVVFTRKLYKRIGQLLLLVAMILLLPLASNLVYVMTDAENVHLVMAYPMLVPLLIPVIAAERCTISSDVREHTKLASRGALILSCLLLVVGMAFSYEFVLITNRAYFSMDIAYENAYAYFTKLTAKIEMQDGFTPNTPVAMIGYATMDSYVPNPCMTGVLVGNDALNIYTRGQYLSYFLATDYHYADAETCDEIKKTQIFQDMPCYPAEGAIATIDGVITVKFSS